MSSRGVNKVIIVGNLGNEPESRFLSSGSAVCNFSVATSETWKDKQTGEQQERTEWHRITMYGRLAEIAGEYLHKGSKVYLEGSLRTRKWQDQSGNDRYTTEINANNLQMLDSRNSGGGDGGGYQQSAPQQRSQPQMSQQQNAPAAAAQEIPSTPSNNNFDDFDDDIPF